MTAPTVDQLFAAISLMREDVLEIDPNDLDNCQVNLVLSIIDRHTPSRSHDTCRPVSVSGLIQGISQQPDAQRDPSQADEFTTSLNFNL
jgi:hypothetical protein